MMTTPTKNQLQELVDAPSESLEVEYKSWLDLESPDHCANLARHIAALANHGGGAIIFGFSDNMQPTANGRSQINRDVISSIVKRYIEPPFQCEVLVTRSAIGVEHPIVLVPPHGPSPVCAKRNGPNVNGRPGGIVQGTYYVRKPGPASEPIATGIEWAPVIRRCVMHERASILGAIDAALRPSAQDTEKEGEPLKRWHDAAHAKFLTLAREPSQFLDLVNNHWQCSYSLSAAGEVIPAEKLATVLRLVNREVRDLVQTGWSMFHEFARVPLAPYFTEDPNAGVGDSDFLECALLQDMQTMGADFWRVAPSGKVTLIREYWEDVIYDNVSSRPKPGTSINPKLLAKSLAELVRHADGLSERFANATTVAFRCEWWGLSDRFASDAMGLGFRGQQSRTDHRVVSGSWPVASLNTRLAEIVATLGSPVARALGIGDIFTTEWIEGQRRDWIS